MESMLTDILRSLDQGVVYQDAQGGVVFFNRAAQGLLGLDSGPIGQAELAQANRGLLYENGEPCPPQEHPAAITLRTGNAQNRQVRGIQGQDGAVTWLAINALPVAAKVGQPAGVVWTLTDITKRKRLEDERLLSIQILQLIHEANDKKSLIKAVLPRLQAYSGCQAVGIRLRQGDDYPYYETSGFPSSFVRLENSLCAYDEHGEVARDDAGQPALECMCGNILQGRTDPAQSFFTNGGSFWSSCTTDLLANTTSAQRQARTRNRCNGAGYESVALIPLRADGETFGLIQFNDQRKGRFTQDKILFLERRAHHLAIFLSRLQMKEKLAHREELYRQLVDNANEVVVVVQEGLGHYFNLQVEKLTGYPLAEVQGKPVAGLIHPQDRERLIEDIASFDAPGAEPLITSYRIITRDGREKVVQTNSAAIQWEGRPAIISLVSDITELTRAQQEKELLLRQWRLALDAARLGWWRYDPLTQESTWDRRYAEIFQVSGQGGPNQAILDMIHTDDLPQVLSRVEAALSPADPQPYSAEFRIQRPDGAQRWIAAHGLAEFQGQGPERRAVGFTGTVEDITRRKRAEEDLRQSESLFRSLFENMLNGYAYCRMIYQEGRPVDFEYLRVNAAFTKLTGLRDVEGRRASEVIPGIREMDPWLFERYGRVASTGRPQRFEQHVTALGMWFSVAVYSPHQGHFVSVFDVITERKQAEQALHQSEQQFRTAFESAPEGMALVDAQMRFIKVNPRLCEILGYRENELLGRTFNRFTHPDDHQGGLDRWKSLLSGEASANRAEKRFIHKNGQVVWVLISNAAARDAKGRFMHVLSHLYDITERKRTEEALRLSESKFAKAFQHSPLWVVITTVAEGRYVDANETFLRDTGFSREEVIGRTSADLGIRLDPTERERMVDQLRREGSVRNLEVKRRTRSGRVLDMLLSAELLPSEGEEAMVVVLGDITALKRAQEEKGHLEAQLRQAQKLEALGTLAGGIAHDFNNILAAILGYAEMTLENTSADSPNQEYLTQVLASTARARQLVQQILTFSRKSRAQTQPLDLNRHVRETMAMLKETIPRMITVEQELGQGLRLIRGNPNQVEQVVMNLATNAKDAMPDGGGMLIRTADVHLDAQYSREHYEVPEGDYVRLEVIDTGMGMPPEVEQKIFDPFFTTKEAGKGTGLGLSTVYGIVRDHGGHIQCHSHPGHGSTFVIHFPALNPEDALMGDDSQPAQTGPPGGSETILLVDDEAPLRRLGQMLLSRQGYTVLTADSGEEALEVMEQEKDRVDLVVLDVSMPGMGGHRCLAELIKLKPELKVLVASGYSPSGRLKDTLAAGAAGFIAKPFERAKLLELIRHTLDAPG